MIAHAIAKSEIVVQGKSERLKNELYWRLNVRPMQMKGFLTDFWIEVIQKLLKESECFLLWWELFLCSGFFPENRDAKRFIATLQISANRQNLISEPYL